MMKSRHAFRACALLALLLAHLPAGMAAGMQHAFLVQNSGWMEPFYSDANSQLKPLVGAVATTVARPGDTLTVAAFNQQSQGNASPQVIYEGADPTQATIALRPLQVARKGSGALADTDFREAIAATIAGPFHARPGILWIFTNNRNSPGNDPDTVKRNREFYDLVHVDPSITRSLAFPLKMPVKGAHYQATGLMVYALAYGEPAATHLQALVEDGTLGRVFTAAPARLKPLDRDAVRIVPRGVSNSGNVKASLAADGKTLVFDIGASDEVTRINLKAALENLFFPYQIASARVAGTLHAGGTSLPVPVSLQTLDELAPGQAAEVVLDLPVPQGQVPSPWSWAALSAMGKQVTVPATVEIALDQQQLRISDDFRRNLATLFPGDPLSDVFVPPATIQASTARIPIALRVQYPLLPVLLVVGGALLLVVALAMLAMLAGRTARHDIMVDGYKRTVAMKAFATLEVRDLHGNYAGRIKRSLGRPRVIDVAEGHSVASAAR
ncbi:conserved exported hypothetical protein [uncultured Stenotrophomonas sp.]|uniref:Transmembrane protein n=1 Tax=uncultured Stenotrophomonas sp. TaxID=165438 RepID=A0A1Y5Q3H9_9GAMM|nr:conserved exported hypothetical protein [uncultured Stenotrophomonas sp.]